MPPKAIVKVKKVKSAEIKDATEVFNQMVGIGRVNMCVVAPKYKTIVQIISEIVEINNIFMLICDAKSKVQLIEFQNSCNEFLNNVFQLELPETLGSISDERHEKFSQVYYDAKKSPIVKKLIITASNLDSLKIDESKNDRGTTLNHIADDSRATVEYLAFCPFDFKRWVIDQLAMNRGMLIERQRLTLMVTFLTQWKAKCKALYECINSVDIDIDDFIRVIKESMVHIKQQPELQNCTEAFKRIEDSMSMLKNNFGQYYSDFVESGNNSTIIIENFILDVSKNSKSSPALVMQFKKIISFYKNARSKASAQGDKKIDHLFEKIDESIKKLDEHHKPQEPDNK